jgi:predicted aspartyl protease
MAQAACAMQAQIAYGHPTDHLTWTNDMTGSTLRTARIALLLAASIAATACTSAPVLHGTAPLAIDNGGRYTTPVMLNGAGPFAFIVDTGAQASVLMGDTAKRLKLKASGRANVMGASGNQSSGIVSIDDFRSVVFTRHNESMVLIPNGTVSNADGVLGMNVFTSGRIEFGFAKRVLTVGPSAPAPAGFIVQPGSVQQGSFMVVDVIVDGVPAKAMIDTGGRRTVVNPPLQAALGFQSGDARLLADEPIGGATTQQTRAWKTALGKIVVGGMTFSNPTVTFADLAVFRAMGLDDKPAMIIGIDQFSRLQAMAIDYPRAELQLLQ